MLWILVGAVLAVGFVARGADGRPPPDLRPPGAGGRDGHAPGPLLAPRAPLVRLLRPPPDRAADVARDGRPAGRPLLPRLRPDLLLPERDHRDLGDRGAARLQLEARADRAGDHARARGRRLPLQPRHASDPARGAAEARRRGHGGRGEHRRRPRRQVVRAGAAGVGQVPRALRGRLRADREGEPAARALRAVHLLDAAARPGRRAARRRAHGDERRADRRRLRRLQPLPRHAGGAAALARDVDRPGPARDRLGRADLPGDGRARGDRRAARAPSSCRRATATCASRTCASSTSRDGRCSTA